MQITVQLWLPLNSQNQHWPYEIGSAKV